MEKNTRDEFSCYIIGEDNLVSCCAKMLIKNKFNLLGICSPSAQIKDFSLQHNIPYTSTLDALELWMLENKCDFLFSIVNSVILSKQIIKLPRYFTINYHNAPLPKYAGVHATAWAILNNEQYHGVTWHIAEEKVDTGDILKQKIFPIDAHDTSFTLDIKCIEAA